MELNELQTAIKELEDHWYVGMAVMHPGNYSEEQKEALFNLNMILHKVFVLAGFPIRPDAVKLTLRDK